jgi:cytochrome c oxidase subunit 3
MIMMFAGLTSAFVVSKSRVDWLKILNFQPHFITVQLLIIGCSVTFHLAKVDSKGQ